MRTSQSLRVEPVSLDDARAFVARHHRHHPAPVGHKYSIGVADPAGVRHGVVIVGRPIARRLDDTRTLEAVRVCTDATPNACSALLAAAWRAARNLGYHRMLTYTQAGESGASLRAAGWRKVAELRPRTGWDTPGRPRRETHPTQVRRYRWEITTAEFDPETFRHTTGQNRDETRCEICDTPVPHARTGRRPRFCSPACRQVAYRRRKAT
jgi:hypothetical protein